MAIRNIFLQPSCRLSTSSSNRTTLRLKRSRQIPGFSTVAPLARRYSRSKESTALGKGLAADGAIDSPFVHVVSPSGQLSGPQSPSTILDTLDTNRFTLQLVSIPPRNPSPRQTNWPVAKILLRSEVRKVELAALKAEKDRRRTRGSGGPITKTLEINWGVDQHDLKHKMDRMKTFLEKGWRVDVELAPRKRKRKATEDECRDVVRKILLAAQENGTRERVPLEGVLCGIAKLSLEGKQCTAKSGESDPGEVQSQGESGIVSADF